MTTMRAPIGPGGQIMQVFTEGGPTRRLVVGSVWREFDPQGCDLVKRFNPDASLRVLSASTTDIPFLTEGAAFLPSQRFFAMPVESGWLPVGYDRSSAATKFFFVLDPDVAGDGDITLIFRENAR